MAPEHSEAAASAAKVSAVWTGVVIGNTTLSFADVAAILAAVYSALLIVDWFWKKWKA